MRNIQSMDQMIRETSSRWTNKKCTLIEEVKEEQKGENNDKIYAQDIEYCDEIQEAIFEQNDAEVL